MKRRWVRGLAASLVLLGAGCKEGLYERVVNEVELEAAFRRIAPVHKLQHNSKYMAGVGCGEKLFVQNYSYLISGAGSLPDKVGDLLMKDLAAQTSNLGARITNISSSWGRIRYLSGRTSGEVSVRFEPKAEKDSLGLIYFSKSAFLD